jgi:hypothetical protein
MSTKIYDAYLYKGTLHQLLPFLGRMRKHLRDRFVTEAAGSWSPKDFDFGAFTDGLRKMFKSGERFAVIDGESLLSKFGVAVLARVTVSQKDILPREAHSQ